MCILILCQWRRDADCYVTTFQEFETPTAAKAAMRAIAEMTGDSYSGYPPKMQVVSK